MTDDEIRKADYSKIHIDPSMRGMAPSSWELMAKEFLEKVARTERLKILHEIQYAIAQMIAKESQS